MEQHRSTDETSGAGSSNIYHSNSTPARDKPRLGSPMKQPKITFMFASASKKSDSHLSQESCSQPMQTADPSSLPLQGIDEDFEIPIKTLSKYDFNIDCLIGDMQRGERNKQARVNRQQEMNKIKNKLFESAEGEQLDMLKQTLPEETNTSEVAENPTGLEIFKKSSYLSVFSFHPSLVNLTSKLGKQINFEDENTFFYDLVWLQKRCRNSKSQVLHDSSKTFLLEVIICHNNMNIVGQAFNVLSDLVRRCGNRKSAPWFVPVTDWCAYFVNLGAELKDICPHEDLLPCDMTTIEWRFSPRECFKNTLDSTPPSSYDETLSDKVNYLISCFNLYLEQLPPKSESSPDISDIQALIVILLRVSLDWRLLFETFPGLAQILSRLLSLISAEAWPQTMCNLARRICTLGENHLNSLHLLSRLWFTTCSRCMQLRQIISLFSIYKELDRPITDEDIQLISYLKLLLQLFEEVSLRTVRPYSRLSFITELVSIVVGSSVAFRERIMLDKLVNLFVNLDSSLKETRTDKEVTKLKFSFVQKRTYWQIVYANAAQTTMNDFFSQG